MIVLVIFLAATYEILAKVAATSLPWTNGLALNMAALGLTQIAGLMLPRIRKAYQKELKNLRWGVMSETATFLAIGSLYGALVTLPVSVVASIAAIQPLAVLVFERITDIKIGKITRDHLLLPKLIPILLIVIGVALMYFTEII